MLRILMILMFAGLAYATDASCPTFSTPLTFGSATNPIGPANGCTAVDLNFTNFGVTGSAAGSPLPVPPTIGQIYLSKGGGSSPDSLIALTFQAFGTGCSAGTLWCVTDPGTSMTSTFDFTADVIQSLASPPDGQMYALTFLSLFVSGASANTHITESFCVGGPTVAACDPANLGYIEVHGPNGGFYVCSPGQVDCGAGTSITFSQGYTEIGFEFQIELQSNGAEGQLADLQPAFIQSLEPTPEPATFALLGAGIAMLAALRRTRGK